MYTSTSIIPIISSFEKLLSNGGSSTGNGNNLINQLILNGNGNGNGNGNNNNNNIFDMESLIILNSLYESLK